MPGTRTISIESSRFTNLTFSSRPPSWQSAFQKPKGVFAVLVLLVRTGQQPSRPA